MNRWRVHGRGCRRGMPLALGVLGLLAPAARAQPPFEPFFPRGVILEQAADDESPLGESDLAKSIAPFIDGDRSRSFEAVRNHVEAGRYQIAVEALGRLLAERSTADVFLAPRAGEETGGSLVAEARRLLGNLPAESRQRYETEFGADARALLSAAEQRGDLAAVHEVIARYLHTQAGAEALIRLGVACHDRGRVRDAALCWERVRELPHAASFEPLLSLRLAAAWQGAGENDRAQRALTRVARTHPAAPWRIGGAEISWQNGRSAAILERIALPGAAPGAHPGEWPVHGGGPSRHTSITTGDPLLSPRWSQPLTSDAATMTAIEESFLLSVNARVPRIPLWNAVTAGERILQRTSEGVRAFDAKTGRLRWICMVEGAGGDPLTALWTDHARSSLAAGADAFYLLESVSAEPFHDSHGDAAPQNLFAPMMALQFRNRGLWGMGPAGGAMGQNGETTGGSATPNLLTARALKPPREGNLRWRVGGSTGNDEPRLAGMHFIGAPLPHAGHVIALAERGGVLHLVLLEARTGALDWMQPLATVPRTLDTDPFRRAIGATPSLAEGVVVCPTSGGGAVAVDLVLRSLLWVYRYPRRPESLFAPDEGLVPKVEQGDRWVDPAAMIVEGRVLLAPPESEHLHCLDLRTGKLLWRAERGDGLFIAAVHENQVVVAGDRHMSAVRLDNGKPAWTIRVPLPENSVPTGRGLHAGRHYYLPLSNAGIAVFDLEVGWLARLIRSPRQMTAGNLIYHRGMFISQGPLYLEAFDEAAALRRQLEQALLANPGDGEALARLGELELAGGRLEEALEAFRRAWQAAPTERTRNRYAAALFDAIRAMPDREAEFNAELNRLVP